MFTHMRQLHMDGRPAKIIVYMNKSCIREQTDHS